MSKVILLVCVSYVLLSCNRNSNWEYKEIKEAELEEYELDRINNSIDFKCFTAKKDLGSPINTISFAVIEKHGKYYKVNPQYGYSVFEDTTLLLWHKFTMEVNKNGNWVSIERSLNHGNEEISFVYDTVPDFQFDIHNLNEEGVYLFDKNQFIKVGVLTDYVSLHDLKEKGLYYLSSPGVFYKKKIKSSDL